MIKYILFFIAGAVVSVIILQVIKTSKPVESSTKKLLPLIKTKEAKDVLNSTEFLAMIQTNEFKDYAKTLGKEQLKVFTNSLL